MTEYIKREDVLKILSEKNAPWNGYVKCRELPAEDVLPTVHGKWKLYGEPPWYVVECSECGEKWHYWSGYELPKFCSHCGSRMDGGTDG